MIRKRTPTFGKDLRYLSRRPRTGRSRVLGHPSHWLATLAIAIAIGIWLGSSPDAAVERSSSTLKNQIQLVLGQDPVTAPETRITTGVSLLPPIEGFQGVAAIEKPTPAIGAVVGETKKENAEAEKEEKEVTESEPQTVLPTAVDTEAHAQPSLATAAAVTEAVSGMLDKAPAEAQTSVSPPERIPWESVQIRSGDSLVGIFKRMDLGIAQAIRISKVPGAKALINLRTGPYLKIQRDGEALVALQYQPDISSFLQVTVHDTGFVAQTIERAFDTTELEVTVEITDSLYQSALRAGLPNSVIYRVTQIFQWELDFDRDVKSGDRLTVIYEERSLEGRKVGNGPVLAVRLENDGVVRQAIRHVNADGSSAYYTPQGKSLQRAFLRSPIPGRAVTSGFSYNRLHPILKVRRAHLGVDYGAPHGTPVVATADGKVIRASRKGGYGKTIILRHGQDYRTLYAHLSRYAKSVRKGKWVRKGQVIGYVGSTGLSTGPHLHYEIHVAGKARNPRSLKLPRAASVGRKDKAGFLKHAEVWISRLDEAYPSA
ncbi:MAG: peptidoglycan DD-metalloendopeptidase family protein [Arenicellales bacterium]|nr:peptidoglycan DD-metalloendopeptidase family protein [Arenicellales bacterium]MDP6919104.1 peptidoglycan DD-metalloendopeptidase family protein [Arenicellales bacterium]|tara:strand:+ start:2064 stop:3692 length:1629 start_codon:yes stop_codon:yes gene_type:complete